MKRNLIALAALFAASVTSAHAALDASVTTAISTASADASSAILLMIGVAVAIWALRKVMKQFGN